MAAPNQIRANRQNALLSTGPRTPDGIAHASQNCVTHGLHAACVVLSLEDQNRADQLRAALWAQYAPATPIEALLLDDLVRAAWRMQRLAALETGSWEESLCRTLEKDNGLTAERSFYKALHALQKAKQQKVQNEPNSPQTGECAELPPPAESASHMIDKCKATLYTTGSEDSELRP